jgi:hypothetical protein
MRTNLETVALAGELEALTWRHTLEPNQYPDYRRIGRRAIIRREFLTKLGLVLTAGDMNPEPREELWQFYRGIAGSLVRGKIGGYMLNK